MLAMGGTGQQREDVDNVWLFVPNLIGYFRIVALVVAFFVAEPSPLAFLVRARRWATWPAVYLRVAGGQADTARAWAAPA